ncbi:MAG: amidohydrolase family protein [Deltaproteobacteria bacterium]|nr:amidohydrolase family protein [Deltaproteobacteria bacterium]
MRTPGVLPLLLAGGLVSCQKAPPAPTTPDKNESIELDIKEEDWHDPEPAFPKPRPSPQLATQEPAHPALVLRHATILTATGRRIEDGTIVLKSDVIAAVGDNSTPAPPGAEEINAQGKFVTPGIIDTHSHVGVYPAPWVDANSDGNEMSEVVTPSASVVSAYWPQDPAITRASAGGVTVAQILPGSANLIGGLGLTVEMRLGRGAGDVRFPDAPPTLKMACGENPKRLHGEKGGPKTRMGELATLRAIFFEAAEHRAKLSTYKRERALWERKRARAAELDDQAKAAGKPDRVKPVPAPSPPPRDERLEVLADVLEGNTLVQLHCYRASDMLQLVALADELGFGIRSFHHALDAYKIRDVLVSHGIAVSTWADWWGFKMEALDGIPENAALFSQAGGRAVIHSDSSLGIQRLNQEAAKAMNAGRAAGIPISEDEALRWITANPAWVLGIEKVTGTLEVGKRADVVLWSGHPFSVYSRPDLVLVRGRKVFDRRVGRRPTDFEIGNSAREGAAP